MIRIKEMKAAPKLFLIVLPVLVMLFLNSCTDSNAIIDQNAPIDNHNWSYANRVKNAVKIEDPSILYNVYINLRVTGEYKYSNIFVLVKRNGPKLKGVTRFEIPLANKEGEWYGQGSGNLYSYQVPLFTNFKFPQKGTYEFEIEQNMRDNPLHEVNDVGLRVEKVKP
ncbi:MAG: gliding motility lipoprotein GldH [Mucilaginibacter sp.]